MDRRKEARFQVYAVAHLAPLQEPDREIEAQVVDISGRGLRLVTDVELLEDEIIVVETDQHLILAEVRNCLPRGNRFTIGAERIHSAAKMSVPQTESRVERNQALLDSYHQRLRDELPAPIAPAPPVEMPSVSKRPTLVPKSMPAPSVEIQPEPVNEPEPAPVAIEPDIAPAPEPSAESAAEPSPEAPAESPAPAFTFAPTPLLSDPPPFDPELLIPPRAQSRKKAVVVGALCALLALAILVLGPLSRRMLHQQSVSAKTNAPARAAKTVAPQPEPAAPPQPAAAAPAAAKPSTPAQASRISIMANDRSWVTACSDGKVVYNKLFVRGDQENLEFSQRAIVRVGNAGPTEVDLNGKSIGSLGRPGQIRAVELTPDSWRFLHLQDPDGCTQ